MRREMTPSPPHPQQQFAGTVTEAWFQFSHLGLQGNIVSLQSSQAFLDGSCIPSPTINLRVDDPDLPVHIYIPMLDLKQGVVQEKTSPLMIIIEVLDSFSLLEHAGFNMIPLSRMVNAEVSNQEINQHTLVISFSRRDHTQLLIAAEYHITQVNTSKAQSLSLGSTTP